MESKYPDIWIYDADLRYYAVNEKGAQYGPPIYRRSWRKVTVVGETSRSWITDYHGRKVPKNSQDPNVVFSEEELEQRIYVNDHARPISIKVRDCKDADLLKKVAELLGYTA